MSPDGTSAPSTSHKKSPDWRKSFTRTVRIVELWNGVPMGLELLKVSVSRLDGECLAAGKNSMNKNALRRQAGAMSQKKDFQFGQCLD